MGKKHWKTCVRVWHLNTSHAVFFFLFCFALPLIRFNIHVKLRVMILFTPNARLINFSNPDPWLGAETSLFWSVGCLFWKTWWEMWGFINSRTSGEVHFYSLSSFYNPMRFCSWLDRISISQSDIYYLHSEPHVFTGDQRAIKHVSRMDFSVKDAFPWSISSDLSLWNKFWIYV